MIRYRRTEASVLFTLQDTNQNNIGIITGLHGGTK